MSKDIRVDAPQETSGPTGGSRRVEEEALWAGRSSGGAMAVLRTSAGRNLGTPAPGGWLANIARLPPNLANTNVVWD